MTRKKGREKQRRRETYQIWASLRSRGGVETLAWNLVNYKSYIRTLKIVSNFWCLLLQDPIRQTHILVFFLIVLTRFLKEAV